jgi:hypothetical protein
VVPILSLLSPVLVKDVSIFCFGDSQAEVLDYIFHNDPRYRTWHDRSVGWRSGWSSRGLYTEMNLQRILVPVSRCRAKNAFVMLAFGSTDVDINLSYKRHQKGQTVDLDVFLNEMATNLWGAVERLRELDADPALAVRVHVSLVFPYVPLPTTEEYWERTFQNLPAPHEERIKLYEHFVLRVHELGRSAGVEMREATGTATAQHPPPEETCRTVVHVVNVKDVYERFGFQPFLRRDVDHHPDYIASQLILANKLRGIGGRILGLDPRPPLLKSYPHAPRDVNTWSVVSRQDYYSK